MESTYSWNCTCQNAFILSKAWLPPPGSFRPTSLNHPQILFCCCFHDCRPQHCSIASVISSWSLKILSYLINNQLLMQAPDNMCFMEDSFYKLICHKESLCVLSNICDCYEVKSVYTDNPIFWDRMPFPPSPFSDYFKKPTTFHTIRIYFNTTVRTYNLPTYTASRYFVWNTVSKFQHVTMSNFEVVSHKPYI
jgi:hypothetical protein